MKEAFDRIYADLVPSVTALAREAGAIIMAYHGQNYQVEIKDDQSPVTIADQKSSEFLVAGLDDLTGLAVISEENNIDREWDDETPFWVIDPLDGTKEFIDQTGGFCVKIALIEAARPVLGVIYCPVQDVLYHGVRGGQAIKIIGDNTPQVIQTRTAPEKGELTTLFNRKHADPTLYSHYRMAAGQQGIALPVHPKIKPGLPRSLQVAEGRADAHMGTGTRDGSGYAWDVAADDLIIALAGGTIFSLKDGEDLSYAAPRTQVPSYIALGDRSLRAKIFPSRRPGELF